MYGIADYHLTGSIDFISGIDRRILGSFAVDQDLLILADAYHVNTIDTYDEVPFVRNLNSHIMDVFDSIPLLKDDEIENVVFNTFSEMFFWRKWLNLDSFSRVSHLFIGDEELERIKELYTVAHHSNMHDYFYSGIWDITFIQRCLSNNVDASLATEIIH